MRLGKLTIGSAKTGPAQQFKNLKNVDFDFDQDHWVTVVIGWNGTGKSNVLEALAVIFRDLIAEKRAPQFAYRLAYRMGSGAAEHYIHIDADPDREKNPLVFHVATKGALERQGLLQRWMDSALTEVIANPQTADLFDAVDEGPGLPRLGPAGSRLSFRDFMKRADELLPRYVFSYYSGESHRMHEVFRPYLENYDGKLRNGEDPGLKRLFFALPVHSQFVLLAFLIQKNDMLRAFLEKHLGLDPDEGIESVLFVLRQPPWKSKAPDGDPRFWNARGVVRDFLDRLYEVALAPLRVKRRVATSMWNRENLEFLYLYVKDIASLRQLVDQQEPAEFFRDLESTYVSELIDEVRIRVKLKKNDGSVTFRELSEGEQQLLTVLGLLRFTAKEESLFLLDEPDTHLNPRWCVEYLGYLKEFVGASDTSQDTSHIVLTTHNPLAIAELERQQVQILHLRREGERREIAVSHPELDPRGQGYAAIVTSEMFGIASSLDKSTQDLLERQRLYAGKVVLDDNELRALDQINGKLERLGFRFFLPDDEYSRYLRKRFEKLQSRLDESDPEILAPEVVAMTREEREQLADELIDELMAEAPQRGAA